MLECALLSDAFIVLYGIENKRKQGKSMLRSVILTISLLFFTTFSFAQDVSLGSLFKGGKNFFKISGALGGDAVESTSAGDELKAGSAFTFTYGRDARFSDQSKRFLRFSVGYKYGFLRADNGTGTISAIPVNALYMQQGAKFVFGGGPTIHLNAKSSPAGNVSESLSLGLTGQFAYRISKAREIGLSLDFISYGDASANATGVYFTNRFNVK